MPIAKSELSLPLATEDLWLMQGRVSPARPLMQGDIFEGTPTNPNGTVIVVTHPCSMRTGVRLRPRQTVVDIGSIKAPSDEDSWRDGHFDYMPLPGLIHKSLGRGYPAADFRLINNDKTEDLVINKRIAVLSYEGILLLQQRLAHHLTRAVIDIPTLAEVSEAVFTEVELQEEWVECAIQDIADSALDKVIKKAEADFQDILDQQAHTMPLQQAQTLRAMLGAIESRPAAIRKIRGLIADGRPKDRG